MADSLFLMQRYWGSDDSEIETEVDPINKLDVIVKQAKKRKINSETNSLVAIHLSNSEENKLDDKQPIESISPKKKKRKRHVELNADIDGLKGGKMPQKDFTSHKESEEENVVLLQNGHIFEKGQVVDESTANRNPDNLSDEYAFENSDVRVQDESVKTQKVKRKKRKSKKEKSSDGKNNSEIENAETTDIKQVDTDEFEENRNSKKAKNLNSSKVSPIIGDFQNKKPESVHRMKKNSSEKVSVGKEQSKIENTTKNIDSIDSTSDIEQEDVDKFEENDNSEGTGNLENAAFPIIGEIQNKKVAKVHRILPDWLAKPTVIKVDLTSKEKEISELDFLDENTKANLKRCGINYMFPVQNEVIPWLMQVNLKRLLIRPSDLCVSAPTGSGKTLAFVIPIIQSLKNRVVCSIRALIVLPVADLAVQVFKVFETFCKGTDLRVSLVIGQKSFIQEQNLLVKKGTRGFLSLADVIVSTPGRLLDHIDRTPGFSLQQLKYLVIDEADRMLEEIQEGWLKRVESAIYQEKNQSNCCCFSHENAYQKVSTATSTACAFGCVREPLQKLLYSATLSQDPEKLHELSLFRPKLFTSVMEHGYDIHSKKTTAVLSEKKAKYSEDEFIGKYTTPQGLLEQYVVCQSSIKPLVIAHLISEKKFKRVLCFTKSLENAHRLNLVLSEMLDAKVRELSSSLRGIQRKIILEQFSAGKIDILVCSDLMARGMDINNVDCVLSYDPPGFIKTYIHRIGRTARAGKGGVAITLLDKNDVSKFLKMLTTAGKFAASKLDVENSDMVPYEESFKKALSSTSKTIAQEKRDNFYSKGTVKAKGKDKFNVIKHGPMKNRRNTKKNSQ